MVAPGYKTAAAWRRSPQTFPRPETVAPVAGWTSEQRPTLRQASFIAGHYGGNYAFALACIAAVVAILIAVFTAFGREARGISFVN